jgi:hypothetical protein
VLSRCVAGAGLSLTVRRVTGAPSAEIAVYPSGEAGYLGFAHRPNSELGPRRARSRARVAGSTTARRSASLRPSSDVQPTYDVSIATGRRDMPRLVVRIDSSCAR